MLIAIDTATRSMGIALHDGNVIVAEHHWITRSYHTMQLAPEIALMFRRAEKTERPDAGCRDHYDNRPAIRCRDPFVSGLNEQLTRGRQRRATTASSISE